MLFSWNGCHFPWNCSYLPLRDGTRREKSRGPPISEAQYGSNGWTLTSDIQSRSSFGDEDGFVANLAWFRLRAYWWLSLSYWRWHRLSHTPSLLVAVETAKAASRMEVCEEPMNGIQTHERETQGSIGELLYLDPLRVTRWYFSQTSEYFEQHEVYFRSLRCNFSYSKLLSLADSGGMIRVWRRGELSPTDFQNTFK